MKRRRIVKGRTRKKERRCLFKRAREREERNTRERELPRRQAKEKEREKERSGGGDSGSNRVGIKHVLRRSSFSIRARSSSLPSSPSILLCVLLLHFGPHEGLHGVFPLAVALTLSVYTYYAKRVTVGGLGSQTRSV